MSMVSMVQAHESWANSISNLNDNFEADVISDFQILRSFLLSQEERKQLNIPLF